MTLLEQFLDPSFVSLKICGVTTCGDAERLVDSGVIALGVNFWPQSKRYLEPANAGWLRDIAGRILRVGVFVNAPAEHALRMLDDGLIDVIQIHGDETPDDALPYRTRGIPFLKGIGVKSLADLESAVGFKASAVLLDAHAPGVYGGTGATFDWSAAVEFKNKHPDLPVVLAGGIVPENITLAVATVQPAAVDVASGAEISPGIKDFDKIAALIEGLSI